MPRASIEDLLRAGAHFGHLTSRWNPKMASYIFMERNGIHLIDLKQTQQLLDEAAAAAGRFAGRGKKILFVGTKKQAQEVVRTEAERAGMPYVTDRWLGGMLTNFQTIRKSIRRMETLQREEADGTAAQLKKKERLMRRREREKLERVLGGIADLGRLPGALFVVDVRREHIAVDEARKLDIPVIALADTNVDPDLIDFPIPANDDAMKSVQLFTRAIADAVIEGSRAGEIERDAEEAETETRQAESDDIAAEETEETEA
jgi:small subunit ribosomal protein S2